MDVYVVEVNVSRKHDGELAVAATVAVADATVHPRGHFPSALRLEGQALPLSSVPEHTLAALVPVPVPVPVPAAVLWPVVAVVVASPVPPPLDRETTWTVDVPWMPA